MGFPRQEYWSGWPFPPPGDLPDRGIKPASPALADRLFTTEPPGTPKSVHLTIRQSGLGRIFPVLSFLSVPFTRPWFCLQRDITSPHLMPSYEVQNSILMPWWSPGLPWMYSTCCSLKSCKRAAGCLLACLGSAMRGPQPTGPQSSLQCFKI